MNNNITVHQLRKQGFKVCIEHRRRYFDVVNKRYTFLTKYEKSISELPEYVTMTATGGITTITITTPNGITGSGQAKCSKCDLYNKKIGVKLALHNALVVVSGTTHTEEPPCEEQLTFPFYDECVNDANYVNQLLKRFDELPQVYKDFHESLQDEDFTIHNDIEDTADAIDNSCQCVNKCTVCKCK